MVSSPNPTTAVSAPGKVLLAGGYLVLDRAYTGLVFGLSARINVIAQEIKTSPGIQLSEIVVESPQFLEAQWRYGYRLADGDGGIKVTQLQISGSHINPNPFVETTLSYVLSYISRSSSRPRRPTHTIKPSRVLILADNDYYSAPVPPSLPSSGSDTSTTPQPPSRFASFPVPLTKAHKTGLGSSAALVTALTASLLAHYLPREAFDVETAAGKTVLHNLAQAAHCAAQGKVGSGFDVAAAVWGSCLYRRFSPSVLGGLGEVGSRGFGARLEALVNDESGKVWDTEIRKEGVNLPPGVAVRMCDVDCGSQTVGMVKSVLKWRADREADAKELWDELQRRNEALAEVLRGGRTGEIRAAVRGIRELIRKMGTESGVPIEPESQTELLDALEGVEGVYGGVVPGAGGFDALALLVEDDKATTDRLEEFLARWSKEKGGRVSLLAVKGEMEGVRMEWAQDYQGWIREP
ncbi:phosphomevalonate kinase [Coniochaeta ligniaria NRRL 30616]|uniref:Phosphomevalonate kinase n=1 Tax=Coniochaeta ligniaria NRRL 30616 TaxID=1408157 RepID=A0A1J7JTJ3_9PEZI|nr:phosphomevalonate kinase [Coniochaeta ligniaria NRRL 30616]